MIETKAGPSPPVRRKADAKSASISYSYMPGLRARIASRCAATVMSIARRSIACFGRALPGAEAVEDRMRVAHDRAPVALGERPHEARAPSERVGLGDVVAGVVAEGVHRPSGPGQAVQHRRERGDGAGRDAGRPLDPERIGREAVVELAPRIAGLGEEHRRRPAVPYDQEERGVGLEEPGEIPERGQLTRTLPPYRRPRAERDHHAAADPRRKRVPAGDVLLRRNGLGHQWRRDRSEGEQQPRGQEPSPRAMPVAAATMIRTRIAWM